MMSKSLRLQAGALLLLLLCVPLPLRAQMSRQDREAANKMIKGTFFLRLDVPIIYVDEGWGPGPKAALDVSPTEYDITRRLSLLKPSRNDDPRVIWIFFPNDGVHYGKLSFDHDKVEIWMEALQNSVWEIKLNFVHINTLDDFTNAFNQTFSKVPLQDEHPEWPAEVRNAIAAHKLVLGMTKEQAFDVVGTPVDISSEQAEGAMVETWHPRQGRGNMVITIGRRVDSVSMGRTGFPFQLKFVNDKLQVIH